VPIVSCNFLSGLLANSGAGPSSFQPKTAWLPGRRREWHLPVMRQRIW